MKRLVNSIRWIPDFLSFWKSYYALKIRGGDTEEIRVRLRGGMTVVLPSDHGNMDDLSLKRDPANPVPTWIWGAGRDRLASKIARMEEVPPAILTLFA